MITVIADDITGAAEIAGVCLRYGLSVSFGIDSVPNETADVLVIATDSRSATEDEAYDTHYRLSSEIYSQLNSFVFKKCDSVLRGYVLTELSAMLETSKLKRVLLQPTNPTAKRWIKNGIYVVGSEKIENTGFSTDPDFPASTSLVQNLLLQRSTKHDNITNIYSGKIKTTDCAGLFIPDCSSVTELQICCEIANEQTLLCGSAAFFEQVLIKKGFTKTSLQNSTQTISDNFLLVLGSAHPDNKQFIEKIKQINCPIVSFPDSMLQAEMEENILLEWTEKLVESWNVINQMTLSISENKIDFPGSSIILKQRMNQVVKRMFEKCDIKELLIGGGATTYSILNSLQFNSLLPVNELAPGVIRMKVMEHSDLFLTVKPGSYSWPEHLFDI